MSRARFQTALLISGFVVAACLYALTVDPRIGEGYDDSHYLTLARALASGQGFTRISAPDHPPETLYPPGWPLILAPLWWLHSLDSTDFSIFKFASIVFTLIFCALTYGWLRWRGASRPLSTAVTLLTLFSPGVFGFASILFSEMAYAACSVAALWAVEVYARSDRVKWFAAVSAVAAVMATVYIRTVGLALVAASIIYLVTRKQWKHTLWFVGLALLCYLPWLVHDVLTANTSAEYVQEFWLKSIEQPQLGTIGAGELALRALLNVRTYLLAGLPGAIFPSQVQITYVNLPEALRLGAPWPGLGLIVAVLIAMGLLRQLWQNHTLAEWYVALYLGIAVLWPWEPTRFVAPLIPLIWWYFLCEVLYLLHFAAHRHPRLYRHVQRVGLAGLSVFIVANIVTQARYAVYLNQTQSVSPSWENKVRFFEWIKNNTPADSRFAAMDDYQIYLYTNRQVTRDLQSAEALKREQIDYVALVPYGGVMLTADLSRLYFDPVYRSYPHAFTTVYSDTLSNIEVLRVDQNQLP